MPHAELRPVLSQAQGRGHRGVREQRDVQNLRSGIYFGPVGALIAIRLVRPGSEGRGAEKGFPAFPGGARQQAEDAA